MFRNIWINGCCTQIYKWVQIWVTVFTSWNARRMWRIWFSLFSRLFGLVSLVICSTDHCSWCHLWLGLSCTRTMAPIPFGLSPSVGSPVTPATINMSIKALSAFLSGPGENSVFVVSRSLVVAFGTPDGGAEAVRSGAVVSVPVGQVTQKKLVLSPAPRTIPCPTVLWI